MTVKVCSLDPYLTISDEKRGFCGLLESLLPPGFLPPLMSGDSSILWLHMRLASSPCLVSFSNHPIVTVFLLSRRCYLR